MNSFEEFEEERKKNDEILQGKIDKLRAKNKRIIFGEVGLIAALMGGFAAAHALNIDSATINMIRNVAIATSGVSIGFTIDAIKKNMRNMWFHILNQEDNKTNAMQIERLKREGKGIEDADLAEVTFETVEEYAKHSKM